MSGPRRAAAILLRPYARVLFAGDLATGALVLAALATAPRLAAATLVGGLIAQLAVRVAGFGAAAVTDGTLACAAVLAVAATGTMLGHLPWPLLALVAIGAVIASAALQAALQPLALPPLALPFVVTTWGALLASRAMPIEWLQGPDLSAAWPAVASWWPGAATWLDVPAALLYRHGAVAGLLVVAALAWHSRIAVTLAGVGGAAAWAAHAIVRPGMAWGDADTTAAFNAVLTAVALGGVWFVPHWSSFVLAALGAAATALIAHAAAALLAPWSLPVLALPFVLGTWGVLLAMRGREHDRFPRSTRPAATPEDALLGHLMRIRRFGEYAWLPFRLPFRGTWVVTQGHDGPHTHRGPWRHAFDFEMRDASGRLHEGAGRAVEDYWCYGLPVLAAGAGTVETVVDGIPDNPVGGVNASDNWGNVVVVSHGASLHSVYAHLKPGSIVVRPGDRVTAGRELGRCGNSGRSLVPHLHFQVQRGAALGGETLPADFGDVVRLAGGGGAVAASPAVTLAARLLPADGDLVRPVVRDDAVAAALDFSPGSTWRLRDASGREEIARVTLDLWSRHVLATDEAALTLEPYDTGLVALAFEGPRTALLGWLLPALARVPFDQEPALRWEDRVPNRLRGTLPGWLTELAAVVAPGVADVAIVYTAHRTEGRVIIEGDAGAFRTRVEVSLAGAPHALQVTDRAGATRVALTFARITDDAGGPR